MASLDYEQLKTEYDQFQEPIAVVRVNGKRIGESKKDFIISDLEVDVTCGFEASMATFCIYNCYDSLNGKFMVDDLKKYICLGSEVTVLMGYSTVVREVFAGFISKVNYIYKKNDIPCVMLTCMDAKGFMMSSCHCTQLVSENYGDAINEILQKAAYMRLQNMNVIRSLHITQTPDKSAVAGSQQQDTSRTIEMVSESDYEFIVRAAKRFNYEFYFDCGDMVFRKARAGASTQLVLDPQCDIYQLDVQYDCTGVAGTVIVRGTDANKAKLIEAKEKNSNKFSIGNYAKQLIKNKQKTFLDATIQSQSDADYRAAYIMDSTAYKFGTLECSCIGIPDIKPGSFIQVDGMGEGISNVFYVVNVIHQFGQDDGYRTRIIGRTNTLL
jgi:hypothetical protein